MHYSRLGGVKKMFHHIKTLRDGHEDYEPTMVIYRPSLKGVCFQVPLESLWKYLPPEENKDALAWDWDAFGKHVESIRFRMMVTPRLRGFGKPTAWEVLTQEAAAVQFAVAMNKGSGVMLCTAFSLFMCCQALQLEVNQPTLVQLMMFIQDDLDTLKNMPPAEPENKIEEGEVAITINGQTFNIPVELSETDLARENQ